MSLFTSSTDRPLRICRRADLEVREQVWQGQSWYVVKDPLSLKYYRFQSEEYALLEMLDGESSIDDIRLRFEQRFAPRRIKPAQLLEFVAQLHQGGLVLSAAGGQGGPLAAKKKDEQSREWMELLTGWLSMRFPGIDPDELLTWLDGVIGWLFTPLAACTVVLFGLASLLLVAVEFAAFRERLPEFQEFFGPYNWLPLLITISLTKILHEFGHGLACKRAGGECHEMGVLLLVGMPCLYCNVSDIWMTPDKWARIAVGAAGMYVELILSSIATWVWWYSAPGTIHYLALDVMFVCSVSTLVFNANPLMRYDGYYILSDWVEVPNLRHKADAALRRVAASWLLGIDGGKRAPQADANQGLLISYASASIVYRTFVTLSLLWVVYHALEPYGLKILGQLAALAVVATMGLGPLFEMWQLYQVPGRSEQVSMSRLTLVSLTLAAVVAGAMFVPLPYCVTCMLQIEPRQAASVYVTVPGELVEIHAQVGAEIRQGQKIATLVNRDVDLALTRLIGERESLLSRLDSLRRRAVSDDTAAAEVAHTEEAVAALEKQISQRELDRQKLVVYAPCDGILLPPARVPLPNDTRTKLPGWVGLPLDQRNCGAFLEAGTLIGRIGDPRKLEAQLAVDQTQIEFLRTGLPVDIQLEQLPGRELGSHVAQISQSDWKVLPTVFSAKSGGKIGTHTDSGGQERPLGTIYRACAPIDDREGVIYLGCRGQAQVWAGYQTVGSRLWRACCETFHFQM